MHGTAAAAKASAVIYVGKIDAAGNWPLKVDVRDLPALPKGEYYEMFLSRGAKAGRLLRHLPRPRATTSVRLNAPFRLRSFTAGSSRARTRAAASTRSC